MSRKKAFLLLVSFVFVMSLFAGIVFAQQQDNFLNDIFEPFAGINIAATYDTYWQFIDALLYFLLFIGVAQFTLSKQFQGTGGKAIVIAMGIALSVALTLWTSNIGFKLGERLGPITGFILGVLVFIVVVRVIKALTGEEKAFGPAWLIAFGLGFIFINMLIPEIFDALKKTKFGGIVIGILNLLFVIAVFYGVPAFITGRFKSGGGESARGWAGDRARDAWDWATRPRERGPGGRGPRPPEEDVSQAEELNRRLGELERQLREELERRDFDEMRRLRILAELIRQLREIQEELRNSGVFR